MEYIGNLDSAEQKVLVDSSLLLKTLRENCAAEPTSAADAVRVLANIRDLAYENLNQIQHEYLILLSARYLAEQAVVPTDTSWQWNPRQTGGSNEPDLQGSVSAEILVSAEITTSRRPVGTIDKRMRTTLSKLNGFSGQRFYFVRTSAMAARASTIVKANNYAISVVILPHGADEL
ncbi:hypothetical protein ACBG90_04170 [Stutzerimonas kunmingensis]|uniref:hypothetical protein n=1 Tax=Stutzerimonas kunmingensis TaxID=1211807 RepID=UPI0035237B43